VGAVVLFQNGAFLIGGQKASILSTVEPITSLIIGFAFLNEHVGLLSVIGSVLIISASVLISVFDKEK
jgi:drug/metabolite transporter (DMT)-like permease